MMSALRHPANNLDAIEDCWTPLGTAADRAIRSLAAVRAEYRDADDRAQQAIEGGPQQPADVPGAGGDA